VLPPMFEGAPRVVLTFLRLLPLFQDTTPPTLARHLCSGCPSVHQLAEWWASGGRALALLMGEL
jgi:hypothetical protein